MKPLQMMNVIGPLALVLMGVGLWARRAIIAGTPGDLPLEKLDERRQGAVIVSMALIEGGGILLITTGMIVGSPAWIATGGVAAVALLAMTKL